MTRYLMTAVLAFVSVAVAGATALGAPASGQDLLAGAKAARRKAESDLAGARRRILAERKAMAGELQRQYAALESAEARAKSAQASLKRLRAGSADTERDAVLTAHRIRSLISQASASAGAAVGPDGEIGAIERGIWAGLAKRLAALDADLKVTTATEVVIARDGKEARVPVLRLGGYSSYACGSDRRTCGLVRRTPAGGALVVGPYLSDEQAEALRRGARGELAHVPLDVDGSLADRAAAEPKSIRTWLAAGGMFIIPILIVGGVGLILVLERIIYLLATKASPSLVKDVLSRLEGRDLKGAGGLLSDSRAPTARVLLAGIEAMGRAEDQREAAMESALLAEAPRLERSLSLLGALAGVAPLLGLLGTVSGMIATFETISTAGTGNPRFLSGGISEALITTQLGLMVAIPLLLAHAWLRRWVERREAILEYNAVQVFGIKDRKGGQPE